MQQLPFNRLTILLAMFWPLSVPAQPVTKPRLEKCLLQSIRNPYQTLAEEELASLLPAELKLLENFIYTRRCGGLKEPALNRFFAESDKRLTAAVKKDSNFIRATAYNLELLRAFRAADSVTTKETEKFTALLDGCWQENTSVIASTLLTHYRFLNQDKSFVFTLNTENRTDRVRGYAGFYTFTEEKLELEIRSRIVLKGGTLKSKKMPSGKTYTWLVNAKETNEDPDVEYDYQWLNNGPIRTIRFDGIEKHFMRIGEKVFWKCYPAD